jgi:hypothetical protein
MTARVCELPILAVCRPPYPLLQPSAAGLRKIWVITPPAPPATIVETPKFRVGCKFFDLIANT